MALHMSRRTMLIGGGAAIASFGGHRAVAATDMNNLPSIAELEERTAALQPYILETSGATIESDDMYVRPFTIDVDIVVFANNEHIYEQQAIFYYQDLLKANGEYEISKELTETNLPFLPPYSYAVDWYDDEIETMTSVDDNNLAATWIDGVNVYNVVLRGDHVELGPLLQDIVLDTRGRFVAYDDATLFSSPKAVHGAEELMPSGKIFRYDIKFTYRYNT